MQINNRAVKLLSILAQNPRTTMQSIADQMHVSVKTVQRYISELQDALVQFKGDLSIEISPSKGISLVGDYNRLAIVLQKFNQLSVDEEKDRATYVLSYLIDVTEPVTIQELSERIHVSRTTVEKTISDAREFIKDYGAEIKGSNKGLILEASEYDKRKILSELIHTYWSGINVKSELNDEFHVDISLNYQSANMIDEDLLRDIQEFINEFIKKNKLKVNEYQYQSLIIHLAIAIDRIEKDYFVDKKKTSNKIHPLTEELVSELEENFNLKIPAVEIDYLNIHIQGILGIAYDKEDPLEYGDDLSEFLTRELAYLKPDKYLIDNLTVHLNSTIKRLKQNITIRNPYKDKIRSNYNPAYKVAFELALKISEEYDLVLNTDEIAYITLHIQAFFERDDNQRVIDVILVCASGFGTVKLLEQRLMQKFPTQLNIVEVVGLSDLSKLETTGKLIISTIPIDIKSKDILYVNPMLTDVDVERINNYINTYSKKDTNEFDKLLDEDLIFYSVGKKENYKTVIEFIVSQLIYRGYADVGLLESALEREELASTAMEAFSMPHGDVKYINKSAVVVYVNPNGINWGSQDVDVVFFFAIQPEEGLDINEIYKKFNDMLSNDNWLESLKSSGSQKGLKNILLKKGDEE